METTRGIIRKIIVGSNPKDNGMSYQVGSMIGNNQVSEILEDINQFYKFGRIRFLIYVTKPNSSEPILWKALEGVPVTIEYDITKSEKLV